MVMLEKVFMQSGQAVPTGLFGEASWTRALVHGDDFVLASPKTGAGRVNHKMREW